MPASTQSLRAPIFDALVDDRQMATKLFQDWLLAANKAITTDAPLNVLRFGARGNGLADDTQAFVDVTAEALRRGGGTVLIPAGSYKISTFDTPPGTVPISYVGEGDSSIIYGSYPAGAGRGHINVLGSGVSLRSFLIDGVRTTPVGLFYNDSGPNGFMGTGGNDPMHPNLVTDSSVRVHGGLSNFLCEFVTFTHAAGYSALVDAGEPGGIDNASFLSCRFVNNRQSLFGIVGGDAKFGGWGGALYINGDGRLSAPGRVLRGLRVAGCSFIRCDGNACWSHLFGLDELHSDFQITDNYFLDCGLDAILIGGVTGGAVTGNTGRRIGYTVLTDNDRSIPRWLANVNATALDSSGLVKSVIYANNSFLSINGGFIDMDGHGLSLISSNTCRIPYDDEPEFEEDQIAISGASGSGSTSYGVNTNNSSNTPYGAADLNITGNLFANLKAGSIRLFAARRCHATANEIIAPPDSIYPPVGMGPVGLGPNQRCLDNKIARNKIDYSPVAAAPAIFEDGGVSPFVSGEVNSVFGNTPITGNGLATEFQPSPASSSPHYAETVWLP